MKKMKEISPKKWGICALLLLAVLIGGTALITIIVDPYFHYHAPLDGIHYRLYEQRYINDGITRHFEYDAIVIGNSLSENVKTSQVDELFECNSIKLPYSGAGYKELWESLERAVSYNPDVEKVIVFMDTEDIVNDKDYMRYTDYPEYLYDDSVLNDGAYLWNKNIFCQGTLYNILMTVTGKESTTFDEYSAKDGETGDEIVLPLIGEITEYAPSEAKVYGEEDCKTVTENIQENITSVVKNNPDIEFYLIYCPPSIARWGKYYRWREVSYRIDASQTAAELLMKEENVHLYGFQDEFDLVCNLDNYTDTIHFTPEVTEYILSTVAANQKELTEDNSEEYFESLRDFYIDYDYLALQKEPEGFDKVEE